MVRGCIGEALVGKILTTDYCSTCGWCCYWSNHPVPTDDKFRLDNMLELYYAQGHRVYYEPTNKKWYVLMEAPCQHLDVVTRQCDLYGTGKRPKICRTFICGSPGKMWERYAMLVKASHNILKQKFEGRN